MGEQNTLLTNIMAQDFLFSHRLSVGKSIENLVKWFWINTVNILYRLAPPKLEWELTPFHSIILPITPKIAEMTTQRENHFLSLPKLCITQGTAGLLFSISKARLFSLILSSAFSAAFLCWDWGQCMSSLPTVLCWEPPPGPFTALWLSRRLEFVLKLQKYCRGGGGGGWKMKPSSPYFPLHC